MIDLPADLPADLVPLSWLLGVWEGTGVLDYDAAGLHFTGEFRHRVSFSQDGGDQLNYAASAWVEDERGQPIQYLMAETGFWRLARPRTDADSGPALLPPTQPAPARTAEDVERLRNANDGFDLEVSLVHSDGIIELYLGQIKGPRIDLSTDAVVRTASAKNYGAATRMYGLVEGDLLWAWDIAAGGQSLRSHASARLKKVD